MIVKAKSFWVDTIDMRNIDFLLIVLLGVALGFVLGTLNESVSNKETRAAIVDMGCGRYNEVTGIFEWVSRKAPLLQ